MSKQYTQHVQISLYKDTLVIEYLSEASVAGELVSPYDKPGNLGYVVLDSRHVTISQEAYNALKGLRPGHDGLGEIDVWRCTDGKYAFATLGGKYSLCNIKTAETSRQFLVPGPEFFNIAEVQTPEGAKAAVDNPEEE